MPTEASDFQSLSTELLSVLFLVLGTGFGWSMRSRNRNYWFSILFLNLSFWSKYLFAPFAGLLIVSLVCRMLLLSRNFRKTVWIILSASLCFPIFCSLLMMVGGVSFSDATESLRFTFAYALNGGVNTATTTSEISRLYGVLIYFVKLPSVSFLVFMSIFMTRRFRTDEHSLRKIDVISEVTIFALPITALLILSRFSPVFPHYLYLLIGSSIVCVIVASSIKFRIPKDTKSPSQGNGSSLLRVAATSAFVFALTVAPNVVLSNGSENGSEQTQEGVSIRQALSQSGAMLERLAGVRGESLSKACPPTSNVLVWGWSSELYSQYDWQPASRYVNTATHMIPNVFDWNSSSFRRNLRNEFRSSAPDCIVDAVGPGFATNYDLKMSIMNQMPDLVTGRFGSYSKKKFTLDNQFQVDVFVLID
jgi:hypothetical protein